MTDEDKMKKGILLLATLGITVLFAGHSCSSISYESNKAKIENSPQFKDGKFRNPTKWIQPPILDNIATAWDFLVTDNDRKPKYELPRIPVDLSGINQSGDNRLNVTWLGHSSLLINIDGYRLLTDPVFEKSVSIVGPSRFNGDIPIAIEDLPEIDAIVISHDHYDHLNKSSIQLLEPKTKRFFVPLGVGNRLLEWKVPAEKIVQLDWWEEAKFDEKLMLAATPAQHFSGRGLMDRDETLWSSWVIKTPHHNLFFSGDSGYFDGFKKIGEHYGPFDMTFLECGAYNTKWHYVHMYPEETVQAHQDLKGNILHPIHWGTFDLSLHAWFEPMDRLTEAARLANIKVSTPIVGETTVFNDYIPNSRWWDTRIARLKN